MEFRDRMGDDRFADVSFAELQTDPLAALERAWTGSASRSAIAPEPRWRVGPHPRAGSHGTHSYELSDFGLRPEQVKERFAPYYVAFDGEL